MPSVTPDLLAAACGRGLGEPVSITELRRLTGGASRETWSFDAINAAGTAEPLVLRRDPGASIGQTDRSTEYELLRAARDAGVPVPEVRFLLRAEDDLGAGFVMTRVEGETIPRKLLRDPEYEIARGVLTDQLARIAGAIHATPVAGLPRLPTQGAVELVEQFRAIIDGLGVPHPAFELGLRWMADHLPSEPATPALVHGDYRTGNFIVGPEGLRSILDWELAHLGDPVEDLGWFCVKSWRFGNNDLAAGGFGTSEELLASYAAATGHRVHPEHLRFWEVFGTLKWGVICEMQAFSHLQGLVRSVELAALGRRVAEMEWDLLDLIAPTTDPPRGAGPIDDGAMDDGPMDDGPIDDGATVRPTAAELVESVREYLERDVMTGDGRVAFHARVAAKVLATVERELTVGPQLAVHEHARLRALLRQDGSVGELTTALANGIRSETIDEHDPIVLDTVRASVRTKLIVANPNYLE